MSSCNLFGSRVHKPAENFNSVAKHFIKRKPSKVPSEDDFFSTSKHIRRGSAWSSEPALTLNVPQLATSHGQGLQNQLYNQYSAFDDGDSVMLSKIIAGQLGHPELTADERNIMKSTKFKLWKALRYFFISTSFHGLPHIAASQSYIRICYWTFLILVSLGLMLWAIFIISLAYFNFNTYIKTELKVQNQLKFPAVTICNLNQFTKSLVQTLLNYSEDDIFNVALFGDYFSDRRLLTKHLNISELINKLVEMYDDGLGGISSLETFSHKLENMLVSCYFNNQPCFNDHFVSRLNTDGKCFTFNSNTSDVRYTTSPGIVYGLELVLNVEEYEYFLPGHATVGFKVYVHQQGNFPYMDGHNGFTVSPGTHANIILSTEQLEYLEPPYGACAKDAKLDYFPIYTREACIDECITKVTIKMCGCRYYYMPGNATLCLTSTYTNCVVDLLRNFWKHYECDCPLPCVISESYRYELSHSAYPAKHFPMLLQKSGALANMSGIPSFIHELNATDNDKIFDFFKENIVKISLYYNQLSQSKQTEVLEYSAFQFIADFGGHLGLFTGAGFLTFFEFVEVCFGIFYPTTLEND